MENPRLETRWIILGTDGRHVTMGSNSDPSPKEIDQAEAALAASGQAGWLVLMRGGYYQQRRKPSLMMVRPLCEPQRPWAEAVAVFEKARQKSLAPVP